MLNKVEEFDGSDELKELLKSCFLFEMLRNLM